MMLPPGWPVTLTDGPVVLRAHRPSDAERVVEQSVDPESVRWTSVPSPYSLEDMTVSLWLGTTGRLDPVPTDDVLRFEQEFLDFTRRSHGDLLDAIASSQKFEDETESGLEKAYDDFLDQFETSEGGSIKAGHEEHEAIDDEDIDQEQIVKQKKG